MEDLDLFEALSPVTDRFKKLINDCVYTLESNGFKLPLRQKQHNLKFKLNDSGRNLGTAWYPNREHNGNYLITLSKYLNDMTDDQIKQTIYHELGHIINYVDEFDKGYLYIDEYGNTKISGNDRQERIKNRKQLANHGPKWKSVMEKISSLTGYPYSRLADAEEGAAFRKATDSKYKYKFKCSNNCGNKLRYAKQTEFVKTYNKRNSYGEPIWWCPRCKRTTGKKYHFVIDNGGEE